jgi:hypothetical protein
MDGTGLKLCPVAGFGTSGVEYNMSHLLLSLLLILLLLLKSGNFLKNTKEHG